MFQQNILNATVFKLVILLIMEGSEKSESSCYSLIYWDRLPSYHFVAMKKVGKHQILTKHTKCKTFKV